MSPASKNLESVYPLSSAQQGMLFHSVYEPDGGTYLTQVVLKCEIEDMGVFERAWNSVIERHAILRSAMLWENLERPLQAVGRRVQLPIEHFDWRELSEEQRDAELRTFFAADRARGFKLSRAPLMRLAVQRLGARDHQVVWTFHHILLDGWSLPIVLGDFVACYEAGRRGDPPNLPPVRPYADYIAWLRQQDMGRAEQYWRDTLTGVTGSGELVMPAVRRNGGALPEGSTRAWLSEEETAALKLLAQTHRLTLSTIVHGAWGLVLSKYSGQDEAVFGTTVSGRPAALAGVESMVGLFINVLPVRCTVISGEPIAESLARLQQQLVQSTELQYTPLFDIQRWSGVSQRQSLFESILAFENYPIDRTGGTTTALKLRLVRAFEKTNYPLSIVATPGQQLGLALSYDSSRFDADTAERALAHLRNALGWMATHADRPASELVLLDDVERARVTVEWNATAREYPDADLHELVEAQVERRPDACAVRFGDKQLTYRELNARANQLAHFLRAAGVGHETLVGLSLERSAEMVVALLGILKAGAAYVPLDPSFPTERLAFMLRDACVSVLVTETSLAHLGAKCGRVVRLDADWPEIARQPETNPSPVVDVEALAYVMYTSGSTGIPKGVQVRRRALVNFLETMRDQPGFTARDVLASVTTLAFDISGLELYLPLMCGGQVVVVSREAASDGVALAAVLAESRATMLQATPATWRLLIDAGWQPPMGFKILCGGEALPADLATQLAARGETWNLYGPTETTIWSSRERIHADPTQVTIGRPIANTDMYVLDRLLRPVPIGIAGELFIGGDGLARGYRGRPALTAERFVPHPFATRPGARLYRTGDLARFLPDGRLEWIARIDHQVKIRGHRIELGEIEAVLGTHKSVKQVVVFPAGTDADRRLVAYVVLNPGEALAVTELRRVASERLPSYMVPSLFLKLDQIPLTPNGKVDRRALPAPTAERPDLEQTFEAPRTETEERLAQIWAAVLRVGRVGVHDNFFELGGDSILTLQIVSKANQAGLRVTPRDIFDHPTIAQLVTVTRMVGPAATEQRPVVGTFPLTPIARKFFEQGLAVPSHFNQAAVLEVHQPFDEALLRRAVEHLLEHHDALRLVVRTTAAGPALEVAPVAAIAPSFHRIDLSGAGRAVQDERIAETSARLQASMDLGAGRVAQFAVFDLGPRRPARLLIVVHHLAIDVVSWRILLEDLETLCGQLRAAAPIQLPAKTTSFAQWAKHLDAYARTKVARQDGAYWLTEPRTEAVALPVDHDGGVDDNTAGHARSVKVSLTARETKALLRYVQKAYGADVPDVLLTVAAQAIGRWSRSASVLFELEGHGRESIADDVDLSRTIGWFTTAFPVAVDARDEGDPGKALRAVKEQLRAVPRKGIGYGVLRYLSAEPEDRSRLLSRQQPQVSFNYLGQFSRATHEGRVFSVVDASIGPLSAPQNARVHLLEINALVADNRLRVEWRYCDRVHEASTIEAVAGEFMAGLRRLIAHCARRRDRVFTPSDFPLARVDERVLDDIQTRYAGERIEDLYRPSAMQQGMLYHTLAHPASGAFVTQLVCTLEGPLNRPAFRQAWQHVIAAHPVLRSAFAFAPEEMHQVVCRRVRLPWHEEDWRAYGDALEARLSDFLVQDYRQGFDLTQPPLVRIALFRVDRHRYQMVWTFHHSLVDGWSLPLVFQDLFLAYDAMCHDREVRFAPRRPFRDYIAWLQGRDATAAEAFWREMLRGCTAPTALPAPTRPEAALGAVESGSQSLRLSAAATSQIQQLARDYNLTLNTVIQGAWAALLARYSGDADVVYGTTVSGRPAEVEGVESMVGMFLNTLPMRVRVDGPVGRWLQQLQATQLRARDFEHTPLTDVQRWTQGPGGMPLFETLFVFENYPVPAASNTGGEAALRVTKVRGVERVNYPLTFVCRPSDALSLEMLFDRRRFDDDAVTRILGHLRVLLEGMASRPEAQVSALPMLTEAELTRQLVSWNDTKADHDVTTPLPDRVERLAEQQPDALAVSSPGRELTYAELNHRANGVASALRRIDVRQGAVVAVFTDRSCDMVVASLGVVKAGAAYLPIDPVTPDERVAWMLADAGVAAVVTQSGLAERLSHLAVPAIVRVDGELWEPGSDSEINPSRDISSDDLAYIIYTSGSTGRPKGVAVTHRGLANLIGWHRRAFQITAQDRATQLANQGFDAAVWEVWPYLATGGSVHLPDQDTRIDPESLRDWMVTQRITVSFVPTEVAERLMEATWPAGASLRVLLTGADTLRRYPPASLPFIVVNNYGPTECSVVATSGSVPAITEPSRLPTIGRPVDNAQIYLLDHRLNPVPVGGAGEMFIGGSGVARGYHARPALTAERFVPDPFSLQPGARLYKTGDLARYRADGQVEFLGRTDHQVKVRGFRIELGEIEAALRKHDSVAEAIVVARREESGTTRLVAYVIARGAAVELSALSPFVRQTLPAYMVPDAFVAVEAFPLTPNGKIDAAALPAPGDYRGGLQSAFVGPRSPNEEMVAGIWMDLLGLPRVSVHDNFFEVGGHSLLATRLLSRVRDAFAVEIPLRDLFEAPTVAGLAERIAIRRTGDPSERPAIVRAQRSASGHMPLSLAQRRLWFLDRFGEHQYHLAIAFRLSGSLNAGALEASLREIVKRHESLRTSFPLEGGEPVQRIGSPDAFEFQSVDLSAYAPDVRERLSNESLTAARLTPFNLETGPLLRVTLIRHGAEDHVLALAMHHIIADGWSISVMWRELSAVYGALDLGQPSPLPEPELQYADFAAWQQQWVHGAGIESQVAFWRERLANAETLDLPTDRPRPAVQTFNGAMTHALFPGDLISRLEQLSRERGVTLFMTMLAAFATLLHRLADQDDIVVGTPTAGRNRSEIESLVGFFINTVVLRTDVSGNPTFAELLSRVKSATLDAFAHQDVPFDRLVEELRPDRDPSRNPLFQIAFALQNAPQDPLQLRGIEVRGQPHQAERTRFDIELHLVNAPAGLYGVCSYNPDLFDESRIARMLDHYRVILEEVVENPRRRIDELPLMTPAQRQEVLALAAGRTPVSAPFAAVHAEFAARAAESPDAIAVTCLDRQYSYRELNERSNQLAHYLADAGVAPGDLVGLCIDRSLDMLVGILAIVKAGGAYVPLDPAYPADRLEFMLRDSGVAVVVTANRMLAQLPVIGQPGLRVVCVDSDEAAIASRPTANPIRAVSPDALAYVIYTSGSTGRPKGVTVSHLNVARLFTETKAWFSFDRSDVWTLFHSYAFDFSVWEIWGALIYGGRLVVVPYEVSRTPKAFRQLLHREGVTVLNQTPSAFRALIEADVNAGSHSPLALRWVIFGGEALDPQTLQPWFERHGDSCPRLVNMYGITETTVHVTYREVSSADSASARSLIGKPIPDLQLYVLDRFGEPAPIGVSGELFVGGDGVAPGYLNRPELTATRFVADPFSTQAGARLYRTGDRARRTADGDIEYLGRVDHQVKIRGFRIELGEIEAVVAGHEAVREAIVVRREDRAGEGRLVAYVVPDARSAQPIVERRRIERDGLPAGVSSYELPNGLPVFHRNKNETDFLYREIFGDASYLRHGIELPADACIFDVGANTGLFTVFALAQCPDAEVFAFEPIPPVCEILKLNARLHGRRVHVFDCGVSNRASTAEFTYYPHLSIMSSRFADVEAERSVIKAFIGGGDSAGLRPEIVEDMLTDRLAVERVVCELRPLSDVIRERGVERIDLLKVDVEKSELDVLEGVEAAHWPMIRQVVMEVHDTDGRLDRIERLLTAQGFEVNTEQDTSLSGTGLYSVYARRSSLVSMPVAAAPAQLMWRSEDALVEALRVRAKAALPDYMVPSAIVVLDRVPLTPSGKLDRRALPAPEAVVRSGAPAADPTNDIEAAIAAIWTEVLGVERVGIRDNFFDIGGHSLLLARVHGMLGERLNTNISIVELFRYPTIEELARVIAGGGEERKTETADRSGELNAGAERLKKRLSQRQQMVKA